MTTSSPPHVSAAADRRTAAPRCRGRRGGRPPDLEQRQPLEHPSAATAAHDGHRRPDHAPGPADVTDDGGREQPSERHRLDRVPEERHGRERVEPQQRAGAGQQRRHDLRGVHEPVPHRPDDGIDEDDGHDPVGFVRGRSVASRRPWSARPPRPVDSQPREGTGEELGVGLEVGTARGKAHGRAVAGGVDGDDLEPMPTSRVRVWAYRNPSAENRGRRPAGCPGAHRQTPTLVPVLELDREAARVVAAAGPRAGYRRGADDGSTRDRLTHPPSSAATRAAGDSGRADRIDVAFLRSRTTSLWPTDRACDAT